MKLVLEREEIENVLKDHILLTYSDMGWLSTNDFVLDWIYGDSCEVAAFTKPPEEDCEVGK